ncbi:MAG: ribonuclease III [Anaerolineales bacterium]|nr:MAG: ribonuclease III [Anaerolineales bacterium]
MPMGELPAAEASLGLSFRDKTLLQRALTHRSYVNENTDFPFEDNERLEFLGDAVLDFVTAEYLYHRCPEMSEGQLTSLRAALVRTETLADFASRIGLGQHIFLGRGELENGGRARPAILCDCYEALVGALYLDQGLEVAKAFVIQSVGLALPQILEDAADKDAKSALQELSQKYRRITPTYRTVGERGPDHAKVFTLVAMIGREAYGFGQGHSKQAAAQAAAQAALARLEQEVLREVAPDEA